MHSLAIWMVSAILLVGVGPTTAAAPDEPNATIVTPANLASFQRREGLRNAGWFRTISNEEREAVFRAVWTTGPAKVSCVDESRRELIQIVAGQILDDEFGIDLTPLEDLVALVSQYCYACCFNTPEFRPCQLILLLAAETIGYGLPEDSSRLRCVCDFVHLACYCPHRAGPADVLVLLLPLYDSESRNAVFDHVLGSIPVYSVDMWNSPSLAKGIRALEQFPFLGNLTIRTKSPDDIDPPARAAIGRLRILHHVYVCDLDGNLLADREDTSGNEVDANSSQGK